MFEFVNYSAEAIQVFLLILLRLSGLLLIAPVFSHTSIPTTIKVGLVIVLAGLLSSALPDSTIPLVASTWQLAGLAARELLIGFVIGLTFRFLFMGIKTGGALLGYQLGMAIVGLPDEETSEQVSVVAKFWVLVATVIFLTIDGHHLVLGALADSYIAMPPGGTGMPGSAGEMIMRYSAYVFILAIKVAAPVMVTLFLIDVALGTISKMMPTMNVFFVGFPIKIGVGLAVLALSLPLFSYLLDKTVTMLDGELRVLFAAWGEG